MIIPPGITSIGAAAGGDGGGGVYDWQFRQIDPGGRPVSQYVPGVMDDEKSYVLSENRPAFCSYGFSINIHPETTETSAAYLLIWLKKPGDEVYKRVCDSGLYVVNPGFPAQPTTYIFAMSCFVPSGGRVKLTYFRGEGVTAAFGVRYGQEVIF